jgi:hypothetical protein
MQLWDQKTIHIPGNTPARLAWRVSREVQVQKLNQRQHHLVICLTLITTLIQYNDILRLYGHVARFPAGDPAGRIFSTREPADRTRRVGRPHDTGLRQMDRHFAGVGMGRVAAWRMAIRRLKEYRSKVDAATRCRSACFHRVTYS